MKLESRGELQDLISKKSADSDDYREALMDDPKGLLQKHLGRDLPSWLNVEVVEEKADTIYVIAPHIPSAKLADADLEMVAGGKGDTKISGGADCERNYGAMNSVVNVSAEVSLV